MGQCEFIKKFTSFYCMCILEMSQFHPWCYLSVHIREPRCPLCSHKKWPAPTRHETKATPDSSLPSWTETKLPSCCQILLKPGLATKGLYAFNQTTSWETLKLEWRKSLHLNLAASHSSPLQARKHGSQLPSAERRWWSLCPPQGATGDSSQSSGILSSLKKDACQRDGNSKSRLR